MKKSFISIFIIVLLASMLPFASVFAEKPANSVKECIENPKQCNEKPASSNDNAESSETPTPKNTLSAWDFIKAIFALAFVLALIYGALRFVNKRSRAFNQHRFIENLGGTSLGTNRSVQLVKIGERILVVGVGESIQLLKEIEDDEEIKDILNEHNNILDNMMQPKDIINKLFSKQIKTEEHPASFSEVLSSQLKDLSDGRKKLLDEIIKKGSKDK